MDPIGLLTTEHRLIERMVSLIQKEVEIMKKKSRFDVAFLDTMVDFFRTYADQCHHGKEENILFRTLEQKTMSPEHLALVRELITDHVRERALVTKLAEVEERHKHGDLEAFQKIIAQIHALIAFYPKHLEKEDRHLFPSAMSYLSNDEQKNMLQQFHDFDQSLIHTKYQEIVTRLESE